MGDHGIDDGEDLLLLIARESGNGFELAFELGLRTALGSLRAVADAQQVLDGNSQGFSEVRDKS
jgi:hypothetical protein